MSNSNSIVIKESKVFVDGKEVKNERSVIENGNEITDPKKKAELITGSSQEMQKMTEDLRNMQKQSPLFYTWPAFLQWCRAFATAIKNYARMLKGQKIEEPKPVAPAEKKEDQPKDVKKEEKPTEKKEEKPKEADKKEHPTEKKEEVKTDVSPEKKPVEKKEENKPEEPNKDSKEEKKNDTKEQIAEMQPKPAPVSKSENTENKDESKKQSAPEILQKPIVQEEEIDNDLVFSDDEEPQVIPNQPTEKQKVETNEVDKQPQIVNNAKEKIADTANNANSVVQTIKDKGSELLEKGKQVVTGPAGGQSITETVKDKVADVASDKVKESLVDKLNNNATKNTDVVNAAANAASKLLK
ncbi:MAG: hypothetical protein IJ590_00245 [Rickettsiales bacterium]|nr:hypothetical protein [Rickettsiales bacterium]